MYQPLITRMLHCLPMQIQQLGALLRSRAVTSVELVRIYTERLRRCVRPAYLAPTIVCIPVCMLSPQLARRICR